MDKTIRCSLGCGMRKPEGFIGIDIRLYKGVDYVLDIGKDRFPFEDNSVDYIEALQVFEHLDSSSMIHCMNECYRILKPLGKLYVESPVFGSDSWLMHPDHKMHWSIPLLAFFHTPAEGIDPHGYLKGFWDMEWKDVYPQLFVTFYPNKLGGKYPYKEVYRTDGERVC